MKLFWTQYEDLPPDIGYGRFSMEHWITLFVIAVLIVCAVFWFSRRDEEIRSRIMKIIPVCMVFQEAFKDGFLVRTGHFGPGYLPLHLCSLGVFLFLLIAFCRSEKWKAVFSEIAVILILPGSIAALLFPDWAHLYPVCNFMNLYGYAWHGLLVLYPILCMKEGWPSLCISHIHYELVFLLFVVPPVYAFDRAFGCNYMFVHWPPAGTPLELIAHLTGEQWYLAGYGLFSIVVITLIYLLIHGVRKGKKHGK
ncbi:MAG: YwaF family protein [Firmicutes bacterium]|nr:YwaF family protein [Bacillota bacterium]